MRLGVQSVVPISMSGALRKPYYAVSINNADGNNKYLGKFRGELVILKLELLNI